MTLISERTIVSANELSPIVNSIVPSQINFALWAAEGIEMYSGLIDAMVQAGFHVVVLKDVESVAIETDRPQAKDFASQQLAALLRPVALEELELAKSSGKRVAVLVSNLDRLSPYATRFVARSLNEHCVGQIKLDVDDVIVAIGQLSAEGKPHINKNTYQDVVLNRFCNINYPFNKD